MRTIKLTDQQIDFLALVLEYIDIDDLVGEDDDDQYQYTLDQINKLIGIVNRS